jgi:uncharacterized surface protein with fasciclin (FAS1) repeats
METTKKPAQTKNIVATAQAASKFKTFSKALKAAGLEHTLEGVGPFTVFAPTDEAFGKLPSGRLESLLKPENKNELASLLKQHVVSGRTTSKAAKTMEVKTLSGNSRRLKVDNHGVAIEESRVTQADIACTNGVIHAIDKVMTPPAKK